jgi:hypothetical protein
MTTSAASRSAPDAARPEKARLIPLWVKVSYTAFLGVLVPYYWAAYGPTNFLYYCDVALFFTLVALWTEHSLPASMPAVGILLPQTLWCADFLGGLVGWPITGMTAYMFNPSLSLFTRGLSFFHFWLPILLVGLVWRPGYDRRALWAWTGVAWALMLECYLWLPSPPAPKEAPNTPVNINYVYGLSDERPQDWVDQRLFLGLMMIGLPLGIFLPTHWLLRTAFGPPRRVALERPVTAP